MTDPVDIATFFATREAPVAAVRVTHGHIHQTYVVTCGTGPTNERVVLQRLNTAIFRDLDALVTNRERITDHLQSHANARGRPSIVAESVATRSGSALHTDDDGAAWRATRFVEGTRVLDRDAATDDLRVAAYAFAEFARDLDDLPAPDLAETIPHFHDFPRRRATLASAIAADPLGRVSAVAHLIDLSNRLGDRLERELTAVHAPELPARVAHNDAKLDNVLVDSTTHSVAGIVDLDTVMTGTVLNDFGELARTATTTSPEDEADVSKIELDRRRFGAIAEGYLAGAGSFLIESERECLALAGPLMTLENAVRFLTDHLDGDVYYRADRPDHNAERAGAQLRLAELMLAHQPELRATIIASASSTPSSSAPAS